MILSVDTGLNSYGVAIFDKHHNIHYVDTIKTAKSKDRKKKVSNDMEERINHINLELLKLWDRFPITEVVGEMPSFGAQSSSAAVALTTGATIILTMCACKNIIPKWRTPREIKLEFTRDPDAQKEKMMLQACKMYNWSISYKQVKDHKQKSGFREDLLYHVMGQTMGKGKFNHIADAIGAYYTIKM